MRASSSEPTRSSLCSSRSTSRRERREEGVGWFEEVDCLGPGSASERRGGAEFPAIAARPPRRRSSAAQSAAAGCRPRRLRRAAPGGARLARSRRSARSRSPRTGKTKIMLFGPRSVPAARIVLGGDRDYLADAVAARPALERITCGAPPICSAALWSRCSGVISSSSATTPSTGRIVEAHPAPESVGEVGERVDRDRRALLAGEQERRLAMPARQHPRAPGALPATASAGCRRPQAGASSSPERPVLFLSGSRSCGRASAPSLPGSCLRLLERRAGEGQLRRGIAVLDGEPRQPPVEPIGKYPARGAEELGGREQEAADG